MLRQLKVLAQWSHACREPSYRCAGWLGAWLAWVQWGHQWVWVCREWLDCALSWLKFTACGEWLRKAKHHLFICGGGAHDSSNEQVLTWTHVHCENRLLVILGSDSWEDLAISTVWLVLS